MIRFIDIIYTEKSVISCQQRGDEYLKSAIILGTMINHLGMEISMKVMELTELGGEKYKVCYRVLF